MYYTTIPKFTLWQLVLDDCGQYFALTMMHITIRARLCPFTSDRTLFCARILQGSRGISLCIRKMTIYVMSLGV